MLRPTRLLAENSALQQAIVDFCSKWRCIRTWQGSASAVFWVRISRLELHVLRGKDLVYLSESRDSVHLRSQLNDYQATCFVPPCSMASCTKLFPQTLCVQGDPNTQHASCPDSRRSGKLLAQALQKAFWRSSTVDVSTFGPLQLACFKFSTLHARAAYRS